MLYQHLASVVKKLIKVQSVRFGAIPGLLLLCTVALVACNDSQNSVFAQGNSSITGRMNYLVSIAYSPLHP